MTVSFHCESCKKKVKAPDEAGGKWGKCPFCEHRCYIPLPKSADEPELKLAPIDESAESQVGDLMRETHDLTQKILKERQPIDDGPDDDPGAQQAVEKEVLKQTIVYLRQVADGQLKQADQTFETLGRHKKQALHILSAMARAEQPEPELSDVPDGVLHGLIRDTQKKLNS